MQKPDNKKRNTKKEIFLAAAELYAEKGYHGTSMGDLAKRVGIKPASIYNHYPSKESVMNDLLDHYLERMELFYKCLAETEIKTEETMHLGHALNNLMLAYEPEERTLMYQLTRIVHFEQFNFPQAAEAMIGSAYRKYVAAHIHFFDRLSDAGYIEGKENNRYFGEIYARLSLTFGTQFLHPEIEPTIKDQTELGEFVGELIAGYQETIKNNKTS